MSFPLVKLRDLKASLVYAWRRSFHEVEGVEISQGEIFEEHATALVSPANSFGFMDGGIDMAYTVRFGWQLQDRLQAKIEADHYGELPVGQATILETRDSTLPYLICAPTMRVPMDTSETVNAFLAFRAALIAVKEFNARADSPQIESILCPGLCTACGRMAPSDCAKQMARAFSVVANNRVGIPPTLEEVAHQHLRLTPLPSHQSLKRRPADTP